MSKFDLGIALIVGFSIIIGLIRGLTREILSLVSWSASAILTLSTYRYAQSFFQGRIDPPMVADLVSVIVTFAFFLFVFGLLSHYVSGWILESSFGGVDRSLGSFFGFLRGSLVICCVELVASCFAQRQAYPDFFKESRIGPYIYQGSDLLFTILPKNAQDFITQARNKHSGPIQKTEGSTPPEESPQVNTTAMTMNQSVNLQEKIREFASVAPKETIQKEIVADSKTKKQALDRFLQQQEEQPDTIEENSN